eukprot:11606768-Karenia_brevis.AAC.1
MAVLGADDEYATYYYDPKNQGKRGAFPSKGTCHLCLCPSNWCRVVTPNKDVEHFDMWRCIGQDQLRDSLS